MFAKVNTVDNNCPELHFIQELKMMVQCCQCYLFLCKHYKNKIVLILKILVADLSVASQTALPGDLQKLYFNLITDKFINTKDGNIRQPYLKDHYIDCIYCTQVRKSEFQLNIIKLWDLI